MSTAPRRQQRRPAVPINGGADLSWYKQAILYELHVRGFCDSNGDGIGDFPGLTSKLDYLRDLGVTALWLLPFYPSPLRDDGYDIADFYKVNPSYGTMSDFRRFLDAAHQRGLRVVTELVINHTSDLHPWFQKSRRAKAGSRWRDFYVWSDTRDRYADARIIFQDFEESNWTWDPVARAYYWHRFYSHQPDLNYDNPEVHTAVFEALDFWLDMGVDGLRLDAIPYLYEREGTNCENLPETHAVLRNLREHVDRKYPGRMLLAEANQWPEDSVEYFGSGDECHMAFNFPVMPRIYMAAAMEDRTPIVDILEQTPAIPASSQWATFLRNHDELTLEMVTDEERDFMLRAYAPEQRMRINLGIRRRLAPLLGNDRRKIELLNGLLLSLPGTPVLYYGDEIGMGENLDLGDRNGVRTPMQWTAGPNAGFSSASPSKLYFPTVTDPEFAPSAVNVEQQARSQASLLSWTRRVLALRKRIPAFGVGSFEMLAPKNRRVVAFLRSNAEQTILVVANLSRFAQWAEIDLSAYTGRVPVDLDGGARLAAIGRKPYGFMLAPHAFHWLALEAHVAPAVADEAPPKLVVDSDWRELTTPLRRRDLERALPAFLQRARWFAGKGSTLRSASIRDVFALGDSVLLQVQVEYGDREPEMYAVPIACVSPAKAAAANIVANVDVTRTRRAVVLIDGLADAATGKHLLALMTKARKVQGEHGVLHGSLEGGGKSSLAKVPATPKPLSAEQSNSSIVFGREAVMKLYRRVEPGAAPEVEMGAFLAGTRFAPATIPVGGSLSLSSSGAEATTLAILQPYVPNTGDAWSLALRELDKWFDDLNGQGAPELLDPLSACDDAETARLSEWLGRFSDVARDLGRITAEMHLALATATSADMQPIAISQLHQRSLYQSWHASAERVLGALRRRLPNLPPGAAESAQQLLRCEDRLDARLRGVVGDKIECVRVRTHGDYHLGQILCAKDGLRVIDFEGEPSRSIGVRRLRRPAFRDVAGMLRSFQYAAAAALRCRPAAEQPSLQAAASAWGRAVSSVFLSSYLKLTAGTVLVPASEDQRRRLLTGLVLEKALYEVEYEIDHRPDWVGIPIEGILELLRGA